MPTKVSEVAACQGCPMQRLFPNNNFVAPLVCEGTRLVVAEAPGEVEQQQGSPLVGPTGNWLFGRVDEATGKTYGGLYKRAGVDGSTVSRINCINCRPPENVFPTDPDARSYISRDDADLAVTHCFRAHVLPLLSGRTWSRIDLLGDKALRIVAGVEGGIMRWRGSPLPIPALGQSPITVPTVHPAALSRDQTLIPAVVSDLKKCIPGEVRVLCQDLVWRRADRLEVGTEIIATDEGGEGSRGRRLKAATVEAIEVLQEPCVEVVTDQGTLITSTKHGWLVDVRHRGFVWQDAETLKEGDVVEFYKKPWETLNDEPEAHYLAGFLDGEGYISEDHCGFNQNGGELLDRVVACCQRLGFHVTARPLKGRKLVQVYFDGESVAGMRAIGSLRPFRLLRKSRVLWEGRCISGKLSPNAKVLRVVPLGMKKVYAIQTSTKTLITEGFVTHNSLVVPEEHYVTQPSLDQVRAFSATRFAFDIETDMSTGNITMVGLCDRAGYAISVPFGGAYVVELKRIFRAAEELVGQNCLQFDLPVLQEHGIIAPSGIPLWDTMLMHHLLQPDLPHGLAFLGSVFTNKPAWKHLSGDDEALYNCRDVDVTWQCYQQLRPGLVAAGVESIYTDLSVPLARICALMHRTGFKVDPSRIGAVREELTKETADAETRLPECLRTHSISVRKRIPAPPGTIGKSGRPVKFIFEPASETITPWRSTIDVQKFLYDPQPEGLGLPVQLHVKSQRPTSDKIALDRLARNERRASLRTQGDVAERHARSANYLEAIQKLRKLDELLTTFCKEEMLSVDRMYPHFNVHGTASGRLSSSEPNLQNIPASARFIYVPSHEDWRLLEVDYSSIENRLTAYFANDTERLKRWAIDPSFNEHRWTASMFFGIPYEEVDKDSEEYRKAKRINHGSNYGMGPVKIAKLYDMDLVEVRRLCGQWREINGLTCKWQDETGRLAKDQGFLINPFGRKRWFYTDSYFTESLSFLPQSTGADIILRAMVALYFDRIGWSEEAARRLLPIVRPLQSSARLLLQVHDSLVFEMPGEIADEVVECVQTTMQQPIRELGGLSIPIDIKLGAPGASWGEVTKWQPQQSSASPLSL